MDIQFMRAGTKLYLPVEVEGALFSLGDAHGAQGDGEVCGTAITAEAVLAAPQPALREAGLSTAKTASLLDLAAKVLDGTVPLDGIQELTDDEIVARARDRPLDRPDVPALPAPADRTCGRSTTLGYAGVTRPCTAWLCGRNPRSWSCWARSTGHGDRSPPGTVGAWRTWCCPHPDPDIGEWARRGAMRHQASGSPLPRPLTTSCPELPHLAGTALVAYTLVASLKP
jgi:hypothetical protein